MTCASWFWPKTPTSSCLPSNPGFPGLQITRVADFDMLGGAIASDPHVAYTERFRPGAFPRDILFSQPSLRFVHASGVGVNHLVPWDPARVDVCNAAGVQDEAMAQFAIARLIAMTCHFFRYHEQQKQRIWKPHGALRSTGGTLTVVGLGRIGKACARIAGTLGMTVHGVKARAEAVPGVARVVGPEDINDVLSLSDYVIIVTPLTEATRGLIGREAIAAMKPGVMIHNMSRGGVWWTRRRSWTPCDAAMSGPRPWTSSKRNRCPQRACSGRWRTCTSRRTTES